MKLNWFKHKTEPRWVAEVLNGAYWIEEKQFPDAAWYVAFYANDDPTYLQQDVGVFGRLDLAKTACEQDGVQPDIDIFGKTHDYKVFHADGFVMTIEGLTAYDIVRKVWGSHCKDKHQDLARDLLAGRTIGVSRMTVTKIS